MPKKARDYAEEYARRIARGLVKGLSTSRARGHARAGERTKSTTVSADPKGPEESGLKMMKHGISLNEAARSNRISQERLRRYVRENIQATRVGRKWQILDFRRFHFPIYSRGRIVNLWLRPRRRRRRVVT
jgi:hypothetical protein